MFYHLWNTLKWIAELSQYIFSCLLALLYSHMHKTSGTSEKIKYPLLEIKIRLQFEVVALHLSNLNK